MHRSDLARPVFDWSESEFQQTVVEIAQWHHWSMYHTHDSRRSPSGFPDLVLWKPGQMFMAELKSNTGRLSPDQRRVLTELGAAGVETHVWRPQDLDAIKERLARR